MKIQNTNQANGPGRDGNLNYIGHGQLESSPASTSVMHVISHELGHVAEFKAEAIRDNADIRSLDVKIDYEFRNGKLVAVSGETKVTSQKRPEKEKSPEKIESSPDEKEKNKLSETAKKNNSGETGTEVRNLEMRLKLIDSELSKLEKKDYYSNPFEKDISEKKEAEKIEKLQENKRRLEQEISQTKMKELMERSGKLLKDISEKISKNAMDIVSLGIESKTGASVDLSI
ncbi:MAG: hypothetical protein K8R21_04115 [Leptospira sp.]|nr:hypothetical protein [Leptospira sp.]